jgi:hypothetical protein
MKMNSPKVQAQAMFLVGVLFIATPGAFAGDKPDLALRHLFLRDLLTLPVSAESQALSPQISLQQSAPEQKSVFRSVVYSLVVPGMGELYAGGFDSGKYFLIAESGLWLTFTSFDLYGHWLQDDARKFAASHASTSIDGKDDQFFVNIGNFDNVYDYNEMKLRDRDPAALYDPNGAYFWQWDSDQSRARFRDLRVKSDNVINDVRFVAGAIIVNHIASAINAARVAIRKNKDLSDDWQVQTGILGSFFHPEGVVLTLRKTF